jgi:hypothetical protein
MRRNRKCYVCKKIIPPVAVEHLDPFCSVACCRAHYGILLPKRV